MGRIDVIPVLKDTVQTNNFLHHLLDDIVTLDRMIKDGQLDGDIQRIGAEQEVNFINKNYRPAPVIMDVLEKAKDSHFTYEHAQYNGEINIDPIELKAGAFYTIEEHLHRLLDKMNETARSLEAEIILAGILPSIRKSDLAPEMLTPINRFFALSKLMRQLRGEPYDVRIEGVDLLIDRHDTTMFESCNTSFQAHLQIDAKDFVNQYNWAQAISGPVLSCTTNSPVLLGKRLWRETRIALFQQSIDTRSKKHHSTERVPRVSFGTGWLKNSVVEIYKEDVARHRIILNTTFDELSQIKGAPDLKALSIHNGTIYRWNRPCYGITNKKPHLRIENRYIPAGPTVVDQVANSAFWIGLMKNMPENIDEISELMDFDDVRSGFIKAARMGLGAQFKWFGGKFIPAKQLILEELLPRAYEGLKKAGISLKEARHYLSIIKGRVTTEKTGSQWIIDSLATLKKRTGKVDDAMILITAGILKRQRQNIPVHQWTPIQPNEIVNKSLRFYTVDQIMSRDLFNVHANDSLQFASTIMDWRNMHHMLVMNDEGKLMGLITPGIMLHHLTQKETKNKLVKDIMIKHPVTISSQSSILDAIRLMKEKQIGSLPVLEGDEVVGFLSAKDFMYVAAYLFEKQN